MPGFSDKVIDAVKENSYERRGQDYMQYIDRISQNKLATSVKLADLSHNMDINRIEYPSARDYSRVENIG